jgi:tRNA-specific 2-thiouridylase
VDAPRALEVRPRYRCPSQAAHYEPLGEGRARLVFERPQRALTPGQVAALYDGERLLGGGVFETIDAAP